MTAEDVPHDAHVVLNVVNGESVHAQELGEQGLPISLHNVRVILKGRSSVHFDPSSLWASEYSLPNSQDSFLQQVCASRCHNSNWSYFLQVH